MRAKKIGRRAMLVAAAATAAVMRSFTALAPADAATISWTNAAGGNYSTPGNWSAGGPPGATDTAMFTAAGTYNVTLDVNPSNDDMHLGDKVTFLNSVAGRTYTIADQFDMNVGTGTLTLNAAQPITINANRGTVSGALSILAGSHVNFTTNLDLRSSFAFSSILVSGTGSSLSANSFLTLGDFSGDIADMTIQSNATGAFGTMHIGNNANGGKGSLLIQSGAAVTSTGLLQIAVQPTAAITGSLTVTGANSTFTQSGSGVNTIGATSNSTGTVTVGASGVMTLGTGLLTINPTGRFDVQSGGTLNANGDITVNGGTLHMFSSSTMNWVAGRTMIVQNGGQVVHDFVFAPNVPSTTVNVNSGGSLSCFSLNIGLGNSGTMTLDGPASTLNVNSGGVTRIGGGGGAGSITASNGATANFGSILSVLANNNDPGSSGTLTIQSGAHANAGSVGVGAVSSVNTSANTLTVTGASSTLTQSGAGTLTVGSFIGPSGTLVITNNGNYITGTGVTTVFDKGLITVDTPGSNGITVNGDIVVQKGTFQQINGLISWAAGRAMTIRNAGKFTLANQTLTLNANTVTVTGTNSLLATGDLQLTNGSQVSVVNFASFSGSTLTLNGATDVTTVNDAFASMSNLINNGAFHFTGGSSGSLTLPSMSVGTGSLFRVDRTSPLNLSTAVTLSGNGTIEVDNAAVTLSGTVTIPAGGRTITKTGSGVLHLNHTWATSTGVSTILVNAGALDMDVSPNTLSNIDVTNNGSFNVRDGGGTRFVRNVTGSGSTLIEPASKLTANVIRQSAITINGQVQLRQNAGASNIPSFTIAPTARMDLADNKLVTNFPAGSFSGGVYTGASGLVQTGRNAGAWDGNGIRTSLSDALTNFTSIGVATGAQVRGLTGATTDIWAGQLITANSTLVMYTYDGDATLDGQINVDDYGRIDFNIGLGSTGWYNGDFNWDGKINVDDYSIIDFNVGIQGAPFSTGSGASGGLSAVPEPAVFGVFFLTFPLLRRARRVSSTA